MVNAALLRELDATLTTVCDSPADVGMLHAHWNEPEGLRQRAESTTRALKSDRTFDTDSMRSRAQLDAGPT